MNSRRRISAPKLRGQHCIGSNEYFDRAQTGYQNHCRSAQPMSLMGHSRPSQPILPVGALPLRPETGLEAGPANKEDAPVVQQWHAARFVRKHRFDGDPLLSCRPNGPGTSDRRGARLPLSTYLGPEHPSHH
jgi:hypothetical protein